MAARTNLDEAPDKSSRLDEAIFNLAGDLRGKRVLDAGCGQGEWTVELLNRGARVTALDLSPGMVDVTRRRVERQVPSQLPNLELAVAPLEESGLEAGSYDLILGRFILHHVELALASEELGRLLAPGGRALFVENTALNPILRVARRHLTGRFGIPRYGTEDEHPLSREDLHGLSRNFSSVRVRFPVFEFFALFDRQVLRFRSPSMTRLLRDVDLVMERFPRLGSWSYRAVIEIRAARPE